MNERLLDAQLAAHFDHWEASLGPTGWFAGEAFSAADVMMSFPVEAVGSRAGFGARAKLPAFLERIHARPAYKAALKKGGPYAYA